MNQTTPTATYYWRHPDETYSEANPQPGLMIGDIIAALENCERVLSNLSGVTQEGAVRAAWMQARAALAQLPVSQLSAFGANY